MPPLPLHPPLASFQIGLRAVSRASELSIAAIAVPSIRLFSTGRPSSCTQPCLPYSTWGVVRPSSTLYVNSRWRTSVPQVHLRTATIFPFRAVTHYIDLPESYEDVEGLPFRREELTQKESNAIFPSNIPAPQANLLLRILHGRRVAGTLDDPTLAQNTKKFRIADQKKALEYLRKHIPVDEILNAGLRAEDELAAIEGQANVAEEAEGEPNDAVEQFAQTSSQDTPSTVEETLVEEVPTGRLPRKRKSDSPYGESTFDRIRARNIAKREAEEAKQEEERKLREEELAKGNIGTLQTQEAKPRELSEFRKKYIARATSDLEEPPEMTTWQRLLPSFGMAVFVVLGSMGLAALYQAPPNSRRLWPDIPPAAATCISLIAMNFVVFALWKFPPAWRLMNQYMILIAATPKPLQLIGAMFSHQSFWHMAANMSFLWFFGTRLHDDIGRGPFLALYLSSGAVGFAASLTHSVLWRGLNCTTLGASGAVYGLIAAFFWLHKFEEFKILGYPPDPISGPQGLGFLGLILGIHLIPLLSKRASKVDMTSHLAGMLVGIVGIDMARNFVDSKARARAERFKSVGITGEKTTSSVAEAASSSPDR